MPRAVGTDTSRFAPKADQGSILGGGGSAAAQALPVEWALSESQNTFGRVEHSGLSETITDRNRELGANVRANSHVTNGSFAFSKNLYNYLPRDDFCKE
jgi:hypothetical protein